jgi:hypothetical protein
VVVATCLAGQLMTMPHRCLRHITRLCSPPQGLVNRVMRAARAHPQAGLGSLVTDAGG